MSAQRVHDYIGSVITACEESIDKAIVERDEDAAAILYSAAKKTVEHESNLYCWKVSSLGVPLGVAIGLLSSSFLLGTIVTLTFAATIHATINPMNKWKAELLELKTSAERNTSWL